MKLRASWEHEKGEADAVKVLKEQIECIRLDSEAAEVRYGRLHALQK